MLESVVPDKVESKFSSKSRRGDFVVDKEVLADVIGSLFDDSYPFDDELDIVEPVSEFTVNDSKTWSDESSVGVRRCRNIFVNPFNIPKSRYGTRFNDGVVSLSSGVIRRLLEVIPEDSSDFYCFIVAGLGCSFYFAPAGASLVDPDDSLDYMRQVDLDAEDISQFRIVSSGARFTVVEEERDVSGYWEAIRVSTQLDENFLMTMSELMNGSTFYDHPSYMCGHLRDLHLYEFNLNPLSSCGTLSPYSEAMRSCGYIDPFRDMICIHIKGSNRVNVELCTHQEIIYSPKSSLYRTMRKGGYKRKTPYYLKFAGEETRSAYRIKVKP